MHDEALEFQASLDENKHAPPEIIPRTMPRRNLDACSLQLYAAGSVVYGVATFNNCLTASDELRQEIKEAKKDLRGKGITFPSE